MQSIETRNQITEEPVRHSKTIEQIVEKIASRASYQMHEAMQLSTTTLHSMEDIERSSTKLSTTADTLQTLIVKFKF